MTPPHPAGPLHAIADVQAVATLVVEIAAAADRVVAVLLGALAKLPDRP